MCLPMSTPLCSGGLRFSVGPDRSSVFQTSESLRFLYTFIESYILIQNIMNRFYLRRSAIWRYKQYQLHTQALPYRDALIFTQFTPRCEHFVQQNISMHDEWFHPPEQPRAQDVYLLLHRSHPGSNRSEMIHYWSIALPKRVKLSKKLSPPGQIGPRSVFFFSQRRKVYTTHTRFL